MILTRLRICSKSESIRRPRGAKREIEYVFGIEAIKGRDAFGQYLASIQVSRETFEAHEVGDELIIQDAT